MIMGAERTARRRPGGCPEAADQTLEKPTGLGAQMGQSRCGAASACLAVARAVELR